MLATDSFREPEVVERFIREEERVERKKGSAQGMMQDGLPALCPFGKEPVRCYTPGSY